MKIFKIIVLSDIHGNLSALKAVISDFEKRGYEPDAIAVLGDNINYGMRPNEVVATLRRLGDRYRILVNIWGNHEKALLDSDTTKFSTERGREILDYTRDIINTESLEYIQLLEQSGRTELNICGKNILFIHGSLDDPYWGKLNADTIDERYYSFDYVISGHSHIPHLIEKYYKCDNPKLRNKKRTIFINPGSAGQPRNHNPRAQYAYVDFGNEIFHFNAVPYDIAFEQSLYPSRLDQFYKTRLTNGI